MKRQNMSGFTLMELMIVVTIIGVLTMMSYPSYKKYSRETRRSDAHGALSQLANDLEKFFAECGAYTASLTGVARSCTNPAGGTLGRTSNMSLSQNYQLSIATTGAPPSTYTITATAVGKQADDGDCQTLTLTNTGVQGATAASGGSTARCWRK